MSHYDKIREAYNASMSPTQETWDNVTLPKHYNVHPSGVKCIEITQHMNFCLGNAFKYCFRSENKAGAEDLKKAIWYLELERDTRNKEEWREFPRDVRYEISSLGKVRFKETGKVRSLVKIKGGYLTFVTVYEGVSKLYYAHRAVAESFIGEIPKKMHVCHFDGNKLNNRLDNLRIDTVKNNVKAAAKLTLSEVNEIRQLKDESDSVLADIYKVSRSTIRRLRVGISWLLAEQVVNDLFSNFNSFNSGDIAQLFNCIWEAHLDKSTTDSLDEAVKYIEREINRLENIKNAR